MAGTTNATVGPMQFCQSNLTAWRVDTGGQDNHSHSVNASEAGYTPQKIAALAREMLYAGQEHAL